MTKEIFEKLCEDNDITWNDKIIITIYNPFKKWYKFREPKYFRFNGYLLYHDGDEIVYYKTEYSRDYVTTTDIMLDNYARIK